MRETVMMADLSWTHFAEKVSENATVFIPVGAIEQHGPYMWLGVDVIIAKAICGGVTRNIGGLVAPAIPYCYKSQPRSGGG